MVERFKVVATGRRGSALVLSVMAMVLAGCWPVPGQGPDRNAHNPSVGSISADTVDHLTEAWTATTDGAGQAGVGPPIVSDSGGDHLVHVSTTSTLYGFDLATGAERWTNSPAPTLDSEVYFTTINDVDSLSISSRNVDDIWEVGSYNPRTGSGNPIEPWGRIDALRVHSSGLTLDAAFSTSAAIDGGVRQSLYLFSSGTAGALTDEPGDGRLTLGTEQLFHAGAGLMTAEPGDGTHGNGLRAFAIAGTPNNCGADGTRFLCPQWVAPLDGATATTPVLGSDGTVAYTGTDAGTVYAVDTASGRVLWSAAVGSAVTESPALADGALYAPTADGRLVALAADGCGAARCDPLWSSPAGGSAVTAQPAVGSDVVFTGAADGSLRAYDSAGCGAPECGPLWSATTGSRITGDPALAHGKLIIGTQDGRVIAYGIPD